MLARPSCSVAAHGNPPQMTKTCACLPRGPEKVSATLRSSSNPNLSRRHRTMSTPSADAPMSTLPAAMEHIEKSRRHLRRQRCTCRPSRCASLQARSRRADIALAKGPRGARLQTSSLRSRRRIYFLEANPRATAPVLLARRSRAELPIRAKSWPAKCFTRFDLTQPIRAASPSKEASSRFARFPCHPQLGPEMRSTGGSHGWTMISALAFLKSQLASRPPARAQVFILLCAIRQKGVTGSGPQYFGPAWFHADRHHAPPTFLESEAAFRAINKRCWKGQGRAYIRRMIHMETCKCVFNNKPKVGGIPCRTAAIDPAPPP